MKKFGKATSIVLASAMLMAGLTACGNGGSNEQQSSGSAIKIGAIGPLTGGAAIYGQAAMNGAQIAIDEVNAKGGLQFEFKSEDD